MTAGDDFSMRSFRVGSEEVSLGCGSEEVSLYFGSEEVSLCWRLRPPPVLAPPCSSSLRRSPPPPSRTHAWARSPHSARAVHSGRARLQGASRRPLWGKSDQTIEKRITKMESNSMYVMKNGNTCDKKSKQNGGM